MSTRPMICLGLMSGTSVDGIDAALVATDGETLAAFGPRRTTPYSAAVRKRIRSVFGRDDREHPDVLAVAEELTELHAQAVADLLALAPEEWRGVEVIGFHGQTILHAPDRGLSIQIGDGAMLAERAGVPVACDFRAADVAAGGQGAPLAPVYHRALVESWAHRPPGTVAVLNIGGVANFTAISPDGGMVACDTGPGNALLDDWVARHGAGDCDHGGAYAEKGKADQAWLKTALAARFFMQPPPKSLDRDAFAPLGIDGMSLEDGAATLSAFTVRAVAVAAAQLAELPSAWVVCGGGRHNGVLMAGLRVELGVPVLSAEDVGWDGDALEAQAFAYLAARTLKGLPISFPGTTGVPEPLPGGRFHRPGSRGGL